MSARKSDIELIVGAEVAQSTTQMEQDIAAIVSEINKKPQKVKLALDDTGINSQLKAIKSQIAELNGKKINIKVDSEFGDILKSSSGLSKSIQTVSSNIQALSDNLQKLGTGSGFANITDGLSQATPIIEGVKEQIASLQNAIQGFQGVTLNVGISGGNPVTRNTAYGQSARQTIAELKDQARQIELALQEYYQKLEPTRVLNRNDAVMKVIAKKAEVIRDVYPILQNINNPELSLSAQMGAWKQYIELIKTAASMDKIDLSSVTSSFNHGADELISGTQKILTGEAELEAGAEKIRNLFGSGVNAEALTTQLNQINESINNVVNAINSIGVSNQSIESFTGSINSVSQAVTDLLAHLKEAGELKIGADDSSLQNTKQQLADIGSEIDGVNTSTNQLAETARAAGSELGAIRIDIPTSDVGRIQKALTLEGVDSNIANRIANDVVNLSGTVKELSGTWREFGSEGARVASVTVTSLDKMNNETKRTIQYQRQLNEAGEAEWVSTQRGSFKVTIDRAKEYNSLLEKITNTAKRARDFVNKNTEASKTDPYKSMIATVEELEGVIKSCGGDFTKFESAIASSSFKGAAEVANAAKSIELSLSEIDHSLTTSGMKGDPIDKYKNQIRYAQDLLDKNNALSKEVSFGALSSYVGKVKEALETCREEGLSLDEAFKRFGLDGATAFSEGKRAITDFRATISQTGGAIREETALLKRSDTIRKSATSTLASGERALQKWSAAERSRNASSREAYINLKREVEELKSLTQNADNSASSLAKLKEATTKVSTALKSTEMTLVQNGDASAKFSAQIGTLVQRFSSWFTVSQVLMYAVRSIREMISTSIELDSALTQMQVVTKASDSEMKAFANDAAQSSKKVGSSITDFVSSATAYARLGQSMEESSWMAEYTAKLQKIGDIDVTDAQDAVTSIIKAFDIDPGQIDKVMDKMVVVGNNFPVSTAELAEGMTNASSTLAAAGNSFEQSVALLTAANTTVQNAAKSSTGLRTIAARIRNTKTELDELGESMSQAEYDKLVQSLTNHNIALVDANNNFRSTYDIISDISKEWDNMSSMEQSALASTLAGTRQQSILYSLVQEFKEASGSMEAMADSAGALDKAYETYEKSTEFHVNQFKATFQELSANVAQSDILKFFIDTGNAVLSVVNGVAKLTDGIGLLAAAIAAVASATNNIGRDKMFSLDIVNMPIVIIVLSGYGQFRYYGCCDTTV